jgi:hypothetical protein
VPAKKHPRRELTRLGLLRWLKPASVVACFFRFFQLRLAFPDAKNECRRRPLIHVYNELEAIRKQALEHPPGGLERRGGRSFGDYIEAVRFQPCRPSNDTLRINVVGGPDQIHHGCFPQFVSAGAKNIACQEWIGATGTRVDVGDVESGRRFGGLAECDDGEEESEAYAQKGSRHNSTS